MSPRPRFDIQRLRRIGRKWSPIPFASDDEYDSYLLQAIGRSWHGATQAEVAEFLVRVEVEQMGLEYTPAARDRATAVAAELDAYAAEVRTALTRP